MMDSRAMLRELLKKFPAPSPSPVWVESIISSLRSARLPVTLDSIVEQYLSSDLSLSTVPCGILPNETSHQVRLFPTPTLLQICSITEIGSSAFQLQTVAEQRKDVFEGASRIKRMDDEEPEDDAADDKAPAYPRGMLRLELSDGRTVMRAMEYRRIPELVLGETCLGAKLLVQNVKALRNVLLLEPANTQVLGYSVVELEQEQSQRFLNGLLERLGKPPAENAEQPRIVQAPPSVLQQPSRLTLTNGNQAPKPERKSSTAAASARAAAFAAALNDSEPRPVESPYFQQNTVAGPSNSARNGRAHAPGNDHSLPATASHSGPAARTAPRISEPTDAFSDFDNFDDSFLWHVDQVTAGASGGPSLRQEADDDDFGEVDESFFRHIEEPSLEPPQIKPPAEKGRSSGVKRGRVVISDEESDEEKENRPQPHARPPSSRRVGKSSSWADQEVIELSSD